MIVTSVNTEVNVPSAGWLMMRGHVNNNNDFLPIPKKCPFLKYTYSTWPHGILKRNMLILCSAFALDFHTFMNDCQTVCCENECIMSLKYYYNDNVRYHSTRSQQMWNLSLPNTHHCSQYSFWIIAWIPVLLWWTCHRRCAGFLMGI